MRKLSPGEYAGMLYELLDGADDSEVRIRIRSFKSFLIRSRAESLIPRILSAFLEISALRQGILKAKAVSARRLSADVKAGIAKLLGAKKLELEEKIEPSLVGGLRLEYKDTVIDSTVHAALVRMMSGFKV